MNPIANTPSALQWTTPFRLVGGRARISTGTLRPRGNPVAGLARGIGLLFSGAAQVLRQPRLFGLGLIPPLITTLLFVTLFFTAAWLAPGLAVLITPDRKSVV